MRMTKALLDKITVASRKRRARPLSVHEATAEKKLHKVRVRVIRLPQRPLPRLTFDPYALTATERRPTVGQASAGLVLVIVF